MADQPKDDAQQAKSLENSVASGRITAAEAETIKLFFASRPTIRWPETDMQKRMQSSGG